MIESVKSRLPIILRILSSSQEGLTADYLFAVGLRAAHMFRYDACRQIADHLCGHEGGDYLLALALASTPETRERARILLERLAGKARSCHIRARAFLGLGGLAFRQCDAPTALKLYHKAATFPPSESSLVFALGLRKMQAVTLTLDGDHQRAIALLDSILPLALHVARIEPAAFYDYLNSYALELAQVGRYDEATAAAARLAASPAIRLIPNAASTPGEVAEMRGARRPLLTIYNAGLPKLEPEPEPAKVISIRPHQMRARREQMRRESMDLLMNGPALKDPGLYVAHAVLTRMDAPEVEVMARITHSILGAPPPLDIHETEQAKLPPISTVAEK